MNSANSGSLKRIGKVLVLGPLIGGLPFNLLIFTIPFAYLIGLAPALLTSLCIEIWVKSRQNQDKPIRGIHLVLFGSVLGFGACLLTSQIFTLSILQLNWSIYDLKNQDSGVINAVLIFSAMGGFWSAVLLPWLYRSFVSTESSRLPTAAVTRAKDYPSVALV